MNEPEISPAAFSKLKEKPAVPPIIAVTGGKGGTGKTLVATNLAVAFSQKDFRVLLVDSDVENPNSFILLGKRLEDEPVSSQPVNIFVPKFNHDRCVKCGDCQKGCYRHAILQFPGQFPSVMEHLCSGCGVCEKICAYSAIDGNSRSIGMQYFYPQVFKGLDLLVGELTPSEALSAHIVEHIIEQTKNPDIYGQYDLIIFDSAPGAHCDVEKVLKNADLIISITEPTPFGEHDLNRILELLKTIDKKSYFVINRADLTQEGKALVEKYSQNQFVEFLGNINVDKTLMEDYARGNPFVLDPRNFPAKNQFLEIFEKVKLKIDHIAKKERNKNDIR